MKRRIFFTPRLSAPPIIAMTGVRALDYAFAIARCRSCYCGIAH
ncbi:unnamed protein product (plasmid) [Mycetohabitans rhizoxinica HKI 454]|uniref:Uncharacterized protein n=1 Tax=Mycetohabitans rhizoxinica (strain DSM 19002 / CIP 109453 / HKI 454) TaxID=882378 RepID=E5AU17_MYCRK|nr:unnamed protein product [Mycetohabitans rhizoxinica HKI 454]